MPDFSALDFAHHDWRNPDLEPRRTAAAPFHCLTRAEMDSLVAKSPYNLALLGPPTPCAEAAERLSRWLDQGVLVRRHQGYYILRTDFSLSRDPGRTFTRWSVYGGLRLAPWGDGGLLAHRSPCRDTAREILNRMTVVQAQLSPVLGLVEDPEGVIPAMGQDISSLVTPMAEYRESGLAHRLWRLPAKFEEPLRDLARRSPVVVADGHCCYQAALEYQALRGPRGGDAPWDWVFACLSPLDSPGVEVTSTHRAIPATTELPDLEQALAQARKRFDCTRIDSLIEFDAVEDPASFALETPDELLVFRPRPDAPARGLSLLTSREDFLKAILGLTDPQLDSPALGRPVAMRGEARCAVSRGEAQAALYHKPVSARAIHGLALAGTILPPGSTAISPPLPGGLLLHLLR